VLNLGEMGELAFSYGFEASAISSIEVEKNA
jgi:hypothetical protein